MGAANAGTLLGGAVAGEESEDAAGGMSPKPPCRMALFRESLPQHFPGRGGAFLEPPGPLLKLLGAILEPS